MVVDGVELLRLIRDGKIANGDRIQFGGEIFVFNIEEREFYEKGKPALQLYSLFQSWTIDNIFDFKFEILSEEDEEIDIDEVLRIEKDESGREYVAYKNKGETASGYTRSFSLFDIAVVKAIKQLDKKIK